MSRSSSEKEVCSTFATCMHFFRAQLWCNHPPTTANRPHSWSRPVQIYFRFHHVTGVEIIYTTSRFLLRTRICRIPTTAAAEKMLKSVQLWSHLLYGDFTNTHGPGKKKSCFAVFVLINCLMAFQERQILFVSWLTGDFLRKSTRNCTPRRTLGSGNGSRTQK